MNRAYMVRSRRLTPPPGVSRRQWLDLVAAGRDIGANATGRLIAADSPAPYAGYALADFVHLAREAQGTPFPAPGATAAAIAQAFLRLAAATAEIDAFDPRMREILGRAVGAIADALDGLLDLERDRAAEQGRRQMGEREN